MVGDRLKSFGLGLCLTLIIAGVYLLSPGFVRLIDFKVYDLFLKSESQGRGSALPVIVALDEKTIGDYGQWPWPRYRVALLLEKIRRFGPASIGLDFMFPEPDRTSPKVFQKELWRDLKVKVEVAGLPEGLDDHDSILAGILHQGPFVLSYSFLFDDTSPFSAPCLIRPLKVALLSSSENWKPETHLIRADALLCNLAVLSEAAPDSGFANTITDSDGIIRRIPLIVYYEGKPYPSFSLATMMQASGVDEVLLKVTRNNALSLRLAQTFIPLDVSGCMWIKYRLSDGTYDRISASDVLKDRVPGKRFRDKIVLLGTTVAGIGDMHTTPMRVNFPGVEIQATVVDNILNADFISRPSWAPGFELMMILGTGLIISLLLIPGNPLWGFLATVLLAGCISLGTFWGFTVRGLFVSPLMPLVTLSVDFVLLILINLKRAFARAKFLRLAKIKAEEMSRFKSDFLANMSHEIRTPMNAVIGLSYLALQTKLTAKQSDYLNKIQGAGKMLLGIINDILDYSKIEAQQLDMEEIDFSLDDVLDNLSSLISLKTAEKGLDFMFSIDPAVPDRLVGDPLRLGQILTNLTNNAVKFTEHGEIVIALKEVQRGESGITLQFSVRDSGIGLSESQIDKLFQPFTQAEEGTTRRYGGTGLGLSICKQLVTMMAGEIWIDSEEGRGSVFSFTARFGLQPSTSGSRLEIDEDLKQKRIMVVDERPTVLKILKDALISFGFQVIAVGSGAEALSQMEEAYADGTECCDLVFLGWQMLPISGIEIAQRMKEALKGQSAPRIVIVVNHGMEEAILETEGAVADAFLYAPFTPAVLFDTVMDSFGRKPERESVQDGPESELSQKLAGIRGARVLLVEDNLINQQVAVELLDQSGLRVTVAANGREAIRAVNESEFDLVLMDIHMPVMDGLEATKKLRQDERFNNLPIISMSAQASERDRDEEVQAGMNDSIPKPVDPEKLFAVLVRWIEPRDRERDTLIIGEESDLIRIEEEKMEEEVLREEMPAQEEDWPDQLPGLDLVDGLERVLDNRELYKELLQDFRGQLKDVVLEIRSLLERDEREEMRFLVHNIKGVAANLGATDLHKSAARLEEAVKVGTRSEIEARLIKFETDRGIVFETISGLKQGVQSEAVERGERLESGDGKTAQLLLKLEALLKEFSLDADQALEKLKVELGGAGFENLIQSLEKDISDFDYEKALGSLGNLANELDMSLGGRKK